MQFNGPKVAIIIGSGLGSAIRPFPTLSSTPYSEIPGMPLPSVKGHEGSLLEVDVNGESAFVFLGRSHLYEGVSERKLFAQLLEMHRRGVTHVVFTNAVGGLHPRIALGSVVVVEDVVDMTFQGTLNAPTTSGGPFKVIDDSWRNRVKGELIQRSVPFEEGTYFQVLGSTYETRAEIRMVRRLGADIIGMSTAREAKVAASMNMSVCALSVVTNRLSDIQTPVVDHKHVVDAGAATSPLLSKILATTIFAI